jgi:D-amino peptidase
MRPRVLASALAATVAVASGAPAQAQPPAAARRIFISADMEGLAGVVTGDQLSPASFEYARFREFMTEEVLAAIDGARQAGVTEFLVADSHGNMQNLLIEKLPRDVMVVRGTPRPLGMLEGISAGFEGVVFIGYHASTTSAEGVRAHTFSSANLADVRLNGVSVSEGVWNAALAGHFGVPVLVVAGDEAAVKEVAAQVPGVQPAVVKWPLGFHSARTLTPEAARDVIRDAVRGALSRRIARRPYTVTAPLEIEVRFKNYRPAEVLSWMPGLTRADAHAVRFRARDMVEAARFMSFVLNYQAALEP